MQALTLVAGTIASTATALFFAVLLPGLERKIQARCQLRYGPALTTPGFWNILKFAYKERVEPNSPNKIVYYSILVGSFASVSFIFLFSTPFWWWMLGFGSILGLAGLLKIEEASYLMMGSFSKSVMSAGMPWPDRISYSKFRDAAGSYFENVSSVRALKMITIGSFPFYLALLIPFAKTGSVYIREVVYRQNPYYSVNFQESIALFNGSFAETLAGFDPYLLSLSGLLGASAYFIGYNIILNNRPFDIIKPKVDIIEGAVLEYISVWRGLYYLLQGLLAFTLSSLFITLYVGLPLDLRYPAVAVSHLVLVLGLPVSAALLRAYSPVLTFKQIYPISFITSIIGFAALALTVLGY